MTEEIENLAAVLIQCFALILAGYVSGRAGLISEIESKGLARFVTFFSLPALIFKSLATLDLRNISWYFVASIFVSKTIVFVAVAGLALLLTRPTNTALSGMYAIFATQSNDFAIGYPILTSLYSKTYPDFAGYLYVLAPIQLIVLNPVGIFMMEVQKQWNRQRRHPETTVKTSLFMPVVKGIAKNPIIIMTIIGLVWNVSFPHELPVLVSGIFEVLSQSFSAAALFLLGLNMVGKFVLFKGSLDLLLPIVLVAVKVMVLPLVIWFVTEYVLVGVENREMSNFGYLYGTFPAAPTVFLFALQYNLPTETVTTGMVLSTVLSAPMMFVCANMIRMAESPSSIAKSIQDMASTVFYVCAICIPCIVWTLTVFVINKKWRSVTHRITCILLLLTLVLSCSGIFWYIIDIEHPLVHSPISYKLHYVMSVTATFSIRIWTSILAVTLILLRIRSLCYVIKFQWILILTGIFSSIAVLMISVFLLQRKSHDLDPAFELSSNEAFVAVIFLVPSFLTSICGVICANKFIFKNIRCESVMSNARTSPTREQSIPDREDLLVDIHEEPSVNSKTPISSRTRRARFVSKAGPSNPHKTIDMEDAGLESFCSTATSNCCCTSDGISCEETVKKYRESISEDVTTTDDTDLLVEAVDESEAVQPGPFHQILHHVLLLLMLSLSMLIGVVVSVGKMLTEKSSEVFLHLEYLDILFNYGQGIIIFFVFGLEGLDYEFYWSKIVNLLRRIRGMEPPSKISLPPEEDLTSQDMHVIEQFNSFHRERCQPEIVMKRRVGSVIEDVFQGNVLVDWLVDAGLARDRKQATSYSRRLLDGRVIQHVFESQHFHDSPMLYRFLDNRETTVRHPDSSSSTSSSSTPLIL